MVASRLGWVPEGIIGTAGCFGYVCFIQELHRRKVKAGESFGAAYAVGWFDDVAAMEALGDRLRGRRAIFLGDGKFRLE
jgi:hypothetical protein